MKPDFASLFGVFEDIFEEKPQVETKGEIIDKICRICHDQHNGGELTKAAIVNRGLTFK